jgi:hypothetical protein
MWLATGAIREASKRSRAVRRRDRLKWRIVLKNPQICRSPKNGSTEGEAFFEVIWPR